MDLAKEQHTKDLKSLVNKYTVHTFLTYIAMHPLTTTAANSSPDVHPHSPVIDLPWEAWEPHGVHVVQAVAATTNTTTASTASTTHARVPRSFMDAQQQCQQGMQAQPPALVTKEVPLPQELWDASESPQMMLCKGTLQAFQVSVFFCCQALLVGVLLEHAV
jgi:hypothetical protein